MKRISFFVHCEPVPQPRARVSTRGGFARAYVDKKHPSHALKQAIRDAFVGEKLQGPIACDLLFRFVRPKSHTRKQRESGWHTGKADIDNLQKLVFDALNGVAYDDDKQIAFAIAYKRWITDETDSGIHINLWELG